MTGMPDSSPALRGVLPVFQTPWHDDESLDVETLEREIDWLFGHGADGLVLAMVSEVLRLSSEERDELAATACRLAASTPMFKPLMYGRTQQRRVVVQRQSLHHALAGAAEHQRQASGIRRVDERLDQRRQFRKLPILFRLELFISA